MEQEELEQIQDEPSDWFISGFIAPCVWGDVIWSGDTIRSVTVHNGTEYEHEPCSLAMAPQFGERLPINDLAMETDDLPGMWEQADLSGGQTDND